MSKDELAEAGIRGAEAGKKLQEHLKEILDQREEILTAFVAKYGGDPDKIVQVRQDTPDGMRWWVELKKERNTP